MWDYEYEEATGDYLDYQSNVIDLNRNKCLSSNSIKRIKSSEKDLEHNLLFSQNNSNDNNNNIFFSKYEPNNPSLNNLMN